MKKLICLFLLSSVLIAQPGFADPKSYEPRMLLIEKIINSSSDFSRNAQIEVLQEAEKDLKELLKISDFNPIRAKMALEAIYKRLDELK